MAKWKVLPQKSKDLIEQILINRGIVTDQQREKFLNPKLSYYAKDLEIDGIDKSIQRIKSAIKNGELIVVFGDYDVDGICASAILYKGLTSIGAKVLPYIPHREKEGYGLSIQGLDFAKKAEAGLVITVDNGIVAFSQADYAKKLGLDLIITDHHVIGEKKPDVFSIVHSTNMCGAAVAWCLIKNVIDKNLSEELLQFVAIATICDLIPLVELGRSFVVEGLKVLNNSKRLNLGLKVLKEEAGIKGEIGSYEIGYILGPRLNAIGRIDHAIDALRLLCTKDSQKAWKLAKILNSANLDRQKMTADAIDQARLFVDSKKKVHILHSEEWAAGIIGLVAGKITDEFNAPSIAISVGQEISKGSARSIDGINIVELIRKCSDILLSIGGHPGAAGFSIATINIEIFKKRIEEIVLDLPEISEKVLSIDAGVESEQITKSLIKGLEELEPFGFKNPKPLFLLNQARISDIKTVGEGKHLKFRSDNIDAIAFSMGNLSRELKDGQLIDLVFTPELNVYNGTEKVQLKVKDLK